MMKALVRNLAIHASAAVAATMAVVMPAQADERMITIKFPIIACADSELITQLERLIRSGDDPAYRRYLNELFVNPHCKVHALGEGVYLEQMDVLDKGMRMGLQSALSEAFGFNVPSAPAIVRVRAEGDTTYRYTLLQFLL
ncbi:hypothetical protein VW29_19340 [Devosia limi DSM 17137]|uniref:Uncharacterized protein n=2 Tax=Devosia TaxID=46913 RepID=A0A0F5L590_9HYPH|nr:hypothetical protein VW29_19340 [Devosia limi DSM 17137]SHF29173.1 hypothetical protein SAMN02745223_02235 [Devosia limi DSM 17137]